MSRYNVDYFIKKFKAIPPRFWTTGALKSGIACCALGHCGQRAATGRTPESNALRKLFEKAKVSVVFINDSYGSRFPQKTPKGRILAALKYIKSL